MKRMKRILPPLSLVLVFALHALADDARDAIARGNADFAAGRYEKALAAYDQAADDAHESLKAELLHNRAAARFKLGRIDDARELWVRALPIKDAAFEARSRYNLGNCDYADARKALQAQDANAALERLATAAKQYREAIRLDPNLTNARANLELAHRLIEQIKQNSTTQPQSQSQPQSQRSSSQPSKDQKSKSDQNSKQNSDQNQPSSRPSSQQSSPQSQTASRPQDEQQQPEKNENDSDDKQKDEKNQPQPTSQPAAAQTQPSTSNPDQKNPPPIKLNLTREQAERLLQKVRDAERARRKLLRLREAAKYKPADRDW